MNDFSKRLLFRLLRILLIAAILMTALVLLHPEYFLSPEAQAPESLGGLQAGLLLGLAALAVGIRLWIGRQQKKRDRR